MVSEYTVVERILSATVGSIVTSLVATPLDVVKVRLQAQQHHLPSNLHTHILSLPISTVRVNGMADGITKIVRHEGMRTLYRGLVPTLVMSVPSTVIYFLGYEGMRERTGKLLVNLGVGEGVVSVTAPLLSGSIARIMAATAISPIELLRTKMQYHGPHGSISAVTGLVSQALRKEGLGLLWKGLVPTLWRDVPFSGIYWVGLESIRKRLNLMVDRWGWERKPGREFVVSFTAGAISGMMAAALTTPFDVAKTRRQVSLAHQPPSTPIPPYSLMAQLKEIWRTEGARGLTRGIVPRVAKVAPACAIMISSYEVGKVYFRRVV